MTDDPKIPSTPIVPTMSPTSGAGMPEWLYLELGSIKGTLQSLASACQTMATELQTVAKKDEVAGVAKIAERAETIGRRAEDAAQRALRATGDQAKEWQDFRDATARHIETLTKPIRDEQAGIRQENQQQTELLKNIQRLVKIVTPAVVALVGAASAYYGRSGAPAGFVATGDRPQVQYVMVPQTPTAVLPAQPDSGLPSHP